MTPSQTSRAAAFTVVALSVLAGLASRIALARSSADAPAFAGVESLNLDPGQRFGDGAFDGAVNEGVASVRLKSPACAGPVYAAPIELKAVAFVELADRAYLAHPGYTTTNVYRGRMRPTFSHFERVLARNPLIPYGVDYFVRFYTPPGCAIGDRAYVEWANLILDLAIRPSRPDQR